MTRCTPYVAGILMLAAAPAMAADESKADEQIKYRQSAMTLVKTYFGPLGAMSQNKLPFDQAKVAQYSEILAVLAKLPVDPYPPGSEKGDKLKTKAKAEVWTDAAKLKQVNDKFVQESAKLAQVAKGGDVKAIKAQIGAVGKTCKACHDDFKEK